MAEILDEINEEVKQEKLEKFWSENGSFIVISVICVILAVGGKSWWVDHKAKQDAERTDQIVMTLEQNDPAMLQAVAQDMKGDQKIIAQLLSAGLLLENAKTAEDRATAVVVYKAVVESDAPKLYKELAEILSIGVEAEETNVNTSDLLVRLAPLAKDDAPYRLSALELMLNLEGSNKNYQQALDHADAILATENGVTPEMRSRAEMYKSYYTLQITKTSVEED